MSGQVQKMPPTLHEKTSEVSPEQELIQIEIGRTEAQKREKNISHGSYNSLSRAEAL